MEDEKKWWQRLKWHLILFTLAAPFVGYYLDGKKGAGVLFTFWVLFVYVDEMFAFRRWKRDTDNYMKMVSHYEECLYQARVEKERLERRIEQLSKERSILSPYRG